MAGNLLRLAVIAIWLVLLGLQFRAHAMPALGMSATDADLRPVFNAQLGRSLRYELSQAGSRIGIATLSFATHETGFRQNLELRLDPGGPLAPVLGHLATVLTQDEAPTRVAFNLAAEIRFDDRLRPVGGDILGNLGRMQVQADAVLDHRGLVGGYRMGTAERTPFTVASVSAEGIASIDLAPCLPPGLESGRVVTSQVLGFNGLSLTRRTQVLRPIQGETVVTKAGKMDLLRVEIESDQRSVGTAWCDATGTIYRLEQSEGALVAELVELRGTGGMIWPSAKTAVAPVTPRNQPVLP